jgi:bisphosphoglycerate mutase
MCSPTVKQTILPSLSNTLFLLSCATGISDEDIINITLPTGVPILLELDENLRAVGPHQFLGNQEAIQAAIKKVDDQGKVKQGKQ